MLNEFHLSTPKNQREVSINSGWQSNVGNLRM